MLWIYYHNANIAYCCQMIIFKILPVRLVSSQHSLLQVREKCGNGNNHYYILIIYYFICYFLKFSCIALILYCSRRSHVFSAFSQSAKGNSFSALKWKLLFAVLIASLNAYAMPAIKLKVLTPNIVIVLISREIMLCPQSTCNFLLATNRILCFIFDETKSFFLSICSLVK